MSAGGTPAVLFYLLDRHASLAMTRGSKCGFLNSLTTPALRATPPMEGNWFRDEAKAKFPSAEGWRGMGIYYAHADNIYTINKTGAFAPCVYSSSSGSSSSSSSPSTAFKSISFGTPKISSIFSDAASKSILCKTANS